MYDVILAAITAFALTYLSIPSIIYIALKKNLVDTPNERSSHSSGTPSLGGIAIFAGTVFSISFWVPFQYFDNLQYILAAFIIIFLIGAKDDVISISPRSKFLGELFVTSILVLKANVKLTSLYGLMGIYVLPEYVSIIFSIFTILVIINGFNLIDGINGLSSSLGLLITFVFGIWYFLIGSIEFSVMAFALFGSLLAFLKFNITPAKIFMGDTGSLFVGLICAILAIHFIEIQSQIPESPYTFSSAPSIAIGILILPLFDTLRVFILRLMNGKSPFHPDRRHIHHALIDAGLSHMQATGLLIAISIVFIILSFMLQKIGNFNLLVIIILLATVLSIIAGKFAKRKLSKV
ncbi:MAG: undecaprenyl/decaprenyl-phosphate alpha-N-acetylglucosaminyl 1-phosphate transferase [Saprospiraceae bacterium]|jgi:UDP-GlcNAc:undecaprenyl-phosphate GlcNAc-1-phosphate transferase|nr:undecaprenyl/decaprenyl-phosphate alpha-N-acetylglucosaminyl 1-phosphate transferase [Saprospiraceae bacterium]